MLYVCDDLIPVICCKMITLRLVNPSITWHQFFFVEIPSTFNLENSQPYRWTTRIVQYTTVNKIKAFLSFSVNIFYFLKILLWSPRTIFKIWCIVINYHPCSFFLAQIVPNLASGTSFILVSVSFSHTSLVFDHVFTFCHEKMFQA